MLAEKCPNCGAYLPVRRPGITVRTCEFCDLEVPGGAPVVEVPRLTTQRPAVRPPIEDVTPPTRSNAGAIVGVAVVAIVVVAGLLVAKSSKRGASTPSPPAATAESPATEPSKPAEDPEVVALRAAVEQAGGASSLDLVAMGAFAETKIKAMAPDAVLLMLNCTYVRADGRADVALQSDARCTWEYRSPARVKRPEGTPAGIRASAPCVLSFSVGSSNMYGDVVEHSYGLDDCRQWFAARPPRCTPAEIWQRAIAEGAQADAVAHLHFGARYRSGYDPVDPSDEPDRPERGTWRLEIEADGGRSFRHDWPDDCGQGPPTADERAVLASIKNVTVALGKCVERAAGKHDSVEAFEMTWRLATEGGKTKIAYADPGVDIEGMFSGDLDAVRDAWSTCAAASAPKISIPPALGELRLFLRVTRDGTLTVRPPPFD